MVWFKVDDGFYTSQKVLSIPRASRLAAVGLWTMAGNWSGRELSDGRVPQYVLAELGATPRLRRALVEARLWLDRGPAGVEFKNWAEFQPTREQVEEERAKSAERQRKWRERHKGETGDEPVSNTVTDTVTNGGSNDAPTRPDPTRPKDSPNGESAPRKRGTRIPSDFSITPKMRDWAKGEVPLVNIDRKLGEFIDYWTGVPGAKGVKLDWESAWRNGMRKQQEFAERDRTKSGSSTDWALKL